MSYSIDTYVSQRIPIDELRHAASNNIYVELHSIFPIHIDSYLETLNIKIGTEIVISHNKKTRTKPNHIRPRFFHATRNSSKIILVLVTPGYDYLCHYASIIRHYLALHTRLPKIRIFHYPHAEKLILDWTKLDEMKLDGSTIVILGYIQEIQDNLQKRIDLKSISSQKSSFYSCSTYQIGDQKVAFLGVNYSFWGNLSGKLCHYLCVSGIEYIIYAAKLGTLTSPREIYNRIFSPSSYMTLNHVHIKNRVASLQNPLIDQFPHLNSGAHASVPTVLEEDYAQRDLLSFLDVNTIDNEISQMAFSIDQFNQTYTRNVRFACCHFATDYLRNREENILNTHFDLSVNRSKEAKLQKQIILAEISNILGQHLISISKSGLNT